MQPASFSQERVDFRPACSPGSVATGGNAVPRRRGGDYGKQTRFSSN